MYHPRLGAQVRAPHDAWVEFLSAASNETWETDKHHNVFDFFDKVNRNQ
ncbi:MAG: hypothetical protein ABSG51_18705 [Terracidiphilus sp.]|jgi:hypothetical protein